MSTNLWLRGGAKPQCPDGETAARRRNISEKSSEALDRDTVERLAHNERSTKLVAATGLLGAIGVVSCCCLLPLVLLSLGIGGAWLGNLTALAPYKPFLVFVTLASLGYGTYSVNWSTRQTCAANDGCRRPRHMRLAKAGLWIGAGLLVLGLTFDSYIEPLLLGFRS